MKKINLKYLICLICSSVMLYASLNVFCFYDVNLSGITSFLPAIFCILTLSIFKWITEKDFYNIERTENSEGQECVKTKDIGRKKYRYFWITSLVCILFYVLVTIDTPSLMVRMHQLSEEISLKIASVSLSPAQIIECKEEFPETPIRKEYFKYVIKIFCSSLMFIVVYILFKVFWINEKMKDSKVLKKFYRLIGIILIIIFLIVSIYYFIDIPEFKYKYHLDEEGVEVSGYIDWRQDYDSIVIPKKIWGKNVVSISLGTPMVYDKIIIPSTFPKKGFKDNISMSFCNIYMYGEAIEWYEKDGVIYDSEDKEILSINEEVESLYVSEKIEEINEDSIYFNITLKSIKVSPNNKKYYSHDNILYLRDDYTDESGDVTKSTIGIMLNLNSDKGFILPEEIYGDTLYMNDFQSIVKVIIPSGLNRKIDFIFSIGSENNPSEYQVQLGNIYYEDFEGSLYTKGLTRMLELRDYSGEKEIILPAELKDFEEECLNNIVSELYAENGLRIVIDENNPNFVVDGDWLYNKDKTKLIIPAEGKELKIISDTVIEVSRPVAELFSDRYFSEIDEELCIYNGCIYTKDLKTLVDVYDFSGDKLNLHENLENFDEECLYEIVEALKMRKISEVVINENNSTFINYRGILYNRENDEKIMPLTQEALEYYEDVQIYSDIDNLQF